MHTTLLISVSIKQDSGIFSHNELISSVSSMLQLGVKKVLVTAKYNNELKTNQIAGDKA